MAKRDIDATKMQRIAIFFAIALIILGIVAVYHAKKDLEVQSAPKATCSSTSALLLMWQSMSEMMNDSAVIAYGRYEKTEAGDAIMLEDTIEGDKYIARQSMLRICPGFINAKSGQPLLVFLTGLDRNSMQWMPVQGEIGVSQGDDGRFTLSVTDQKKTYTLQELKQLIR